MEKTLHTDVFWRNSNKIEDDNNEEEEEEEEEENNPHCLQADGVYRSDKAEHKTDHRTRTMQRFHSKFLYHSDVRFGYNDDLERERKALIEKHKLCRARSQVLSKENNRRRRALAEKQKQWDLQEQRHREIILQQRKLQIQDATERYQRGHLPPQQRPRRSYRIKATNIKEALRVIRGADVQPPSSFSSNSNAISSISSSEPPSVYKLSRHPVLCAAEAFTKLIREQSEPSLKISHETNIQEKQSPQDTSQSDSVLSESLSCKDSLEDEDSDVEKPQWSNSPKPDPMKLRHDNNIIGLQKTNCPESSSRDNITITNGVTFHNTSPDCSCPRQDAVLAVRQQRLHEDCPLKQPSSSHMCQNGKSKDVLSGAPPGTNIFLNNSKIDNTSQGALQQTQKENHCLPCVSINNLNKFSNLELKSEKPSSAALLQHACLQSLGKGNQMLPLLEETSYSKHKVGLTKGILKNKSEYVSGDDTLMHGPGQVSFGKPLPVVGSCVEVLGNNMKAVESKSIKKNLCWFDELHLHKKDRGEMKDKSFGLFQPKENSEDHQLHPTTVSDASKPGPNLTTHVSTGYHFTKQAWADVSVQVNLHQEPAAEVKAPPCGTRPSRPRVPANKYAATVGERPVFSQTRKGTVLRPQSATVMSQIAKTHGKSRVPCPPPRTKPVEEKKVSRPPYGLDHSSVASKQGPAVDQAPSEGFLPFSHHLIKTETTVMYTPLPPSYTRPVIDGSTKGKTSSGHQETQGCDKRRGMMLSDCGTPTDEEISQLWQGVRKALSTSDGNQSGTGQATENGQVGRNPCTEQSRQSTGSQSRGPPQPIKQSTVPVRTFPDTRKMNFKVAMETAQKQRTVQQHSQHQEHSRLSLEEQQLLQSLDRLDQQLRLREYGSNNAALQDTLIPAPSEKNVTYPHKHRAFSAGNLHRYAKKPP